MGQNKGGLNMEQKRVSFKVAKAIKEAGYPQDIWKCNWFYSEDGELLNISNTGYYEFPAPTYLDVWLWLWKKNIRIYVKDFFGGLVVSESSSGYDSVSYTEPEEAIIAAIEYLVDNTLIK